MCSSYEPKIRACLKSETPFGRGKYIDDEYVIPDWCPLCNNGELKPLETFCDELLL